MANNGGKTSLFFPTEPSPSFWPRSLDSSSQKRETEVGLSNDILIEILSRLPTKTLLGFKCVSKRWCHLISDLNFIRIQLEKSKVLSGFFFQERFQWCDEDIESVTYIPIGTQLGLVQHSVLDFLPEKVVLTASTNGLICCRSCIPSSNPAIYICNPSNKKWVRIDWVVKEKGNSFALAFDPFCHPVNICTDFNVVNVHQIFTETESSISFEIYSSVAGKWRVSEEICYCEYSLFNKRGIFSSGVVHWLTDGDEMLAFNVENEQSLLIKLPLPTVQDKDIPVMCIGESKGYLHYIEISSAGLLVWILEDYYEPNWVLKSGVELAVLEEENPRVLFNALDKVTRRISLDMVPWMDPLAFQDGFLFLRVSTKVYLYHIETRRMEEICTLAKLGPNSLHSPVVLPYDMSLLPLGRA